MPAQAQAPAKCPLRLSLIAAVAFTALHCGPSGNPSAALDSRTLVQVSEDELFTALQPSLDPAVLKAEADGVKKLRTMSLASLHQLMLANVSDAPYMIGGKMIRNSRRNLLASAADFASLDQVFGNVGAMMDQLGIGSSEVSRQALTNLLKNGPQLGGASLLDIMRRERPDDNYCERSEAGYMRDYKGLTMNMIKGAARAIIDKGAKPDSSATSAAMPIGGAKGVLQQWIFNTGASEVKTYATSCWQKEPQQLPSLGTRSYGGGLPAGTMSPVGSAASSQG